MKKSLVLRVLAIVMAMLFVLSACAPKDGGDAVTGGDKTQQNSADVAGGDSGNSEDGSGDNSGDNSGNSADGSGQSSTLRIGVIFNPTDGMDPTMITSPGGMVMMFHLYDTLAMMGEDGLVLSLAESIQGNETGDTFTIKIHDNAKFSDGRDVTGADVVASLVYFSQSPYFMAMYGNIDAANCSSDGKTAVIKMLSPMADFAEASLAMFSPIAPNGEFTGVGAGPYVIKEGDPTTGYTMVANEDYFAGAPAIKEVQLIPVMGSAAQANALATGEIDYAWGLDPAAIQTVKGNADIVIPESSLDSAVAKVLVLNTRVAPFNDPELRRAARLAVDREKLVNTLMGESGEVANDMLGKGYSTYPADLPQRTADKDEARRIFEEKGVTEFTIVASDIVPGLVSASELMAQEFAEIGVTVEVREVDPQSFFSQMGEIYQEQAFTFYWMNRPPLVEFRSEIQSTSPYNVSGYFSDITESEFQRAVSNTDKTVQNDAVRKICEDLYENGGELIWGYQKQLSAYRKGLEGVFTTQSIPWLAGATFVPED